jgi:hypothetical protein
MKNNQIEVRKGEQKGYKLNRNADVGRMVFNFIV